MKYGNIRRKEKHIPMNRRGRGPPESEEKGEGNKIEVSNNKEFSRLATSRPHEFQGRICQAASDKVARGRLVSLEGFSFLFPAKK